MPNSLNSNVARLIVMPERDGALLGANRVGVSLSDQVSATIGVLVSHPGEVNERFAAVRVHSLREMPAQHFAIGERLAADLELEEERTTPWELRTTDFSTVTATDVVLEVAVESQLDEVVNTIARSRDLAGSLLWKPAQSGDRQQINVGGQPFAVAELLPQASGDAVFEITEQTRFKVFSSGMKTGVDIVLLADCSGSMSVDDLSVQEAASERGLLSRVFAKPAQQSVTRIEFLRTQLQNLLERRLQISGRVARIALVSFTNESQIRFPRNAGMAEFDSNTGEELLQELHGAVALLNAKGATNISQAINFAAELLHQHGRPGNERLVVLISDGAHYVPKGVESTGEVVEEFEEPVVLMERLHRQLKIRLHAIGISNSEVYRKWCALQHRQPETGFEPNHTLLDRLVQVGGGDLSHQGDADVLERYFSGLASGVTRQVPRLSAAERLELQTFEVDRFQEFASGRVNQAERIAYESRRKDLFEQVFRLQDDCNKAALAHGGIRVYERIETSNFIVQHSSRSVTSFEEFSQFAIDLYKAFREAQSKEVAAAARDASANRPISADRPKQHALATMGAIFAADRFQMLCGLRHYSAHLASGAGGRFVGDFFQRAVGERFPRNDDVAKWMRLHLAVLDELVAVLKELDGAIRALPSSESAPTPANSQTKIRGWEVTN